MKTVDTSGMSCPQPVLMTKKALSQENDEVDIIVDNNTSKGNVERFLKSTACNFTIEEKDDTFILKVRK